MTWNALTVPAPTATWIPQRHSHGRLHAMREACPPATVLLIEDNPADVRLLQEALQAVEFHGRFLTAPDLTQAGEALSDLEASGHLPDLILLDWYLPRGTGDEFLHTLRASCQWSRIPVAVLSGSSQPSDATLARQKGAGAFWAKPIEWCGWIRVAHRVRRLCRIARQPLVRHSAAGKA